MHTLSAVCEFTHHMILWLQRIAGSTGRTAAPKSTDRCQLWAVTNVRQTYQTWAASSSKEHPQDPEQALRLNRPRRE
jgi:hypothetical protein